MQDNMAESSDRLEGTTLRRLFSADEEQLLDAIDDLRHQNIEDFLEEKSLPQIIVCGDTSSGKSSVLEALTRVSFPINHGVCTKFPTELRLRRAAESRVSCSIKPSANRTEEERKHLSKFRKSFESPDKFSELIEAAWECMNELKRDVDFVDDALQVEIIGPKMAPLTIVDLPGIIQNQNEPGTEDINSVKQIVKRYMEQENSIILAVLAASNNIVNQGVITMIIDTPNGKERALGIITKPDMLSAGSEYERGWFDLASRDRYNFGHKWHVIRSRNDQERASQSTFDDRDQKETEFFSSGIWANLPGSNSGIESLRQKLSNLLFNHIKAKLPMILRDIDAKLNRCESELKKLGETRDTSKDQRKYLSKISADFGRSLTDALSGRYHPKDFFGDALSTTGKKKRLRAYIRNLNDEFATTMLEHGHKWHVVEDGEVSDEGKSPSQEPKSERQEVIAKSKFLEETVDKLARSERATELAGMSNPGVVRALFQQQSERWGELARKHLDTVCEIVHDFLQDLLKHLTNAYTYNQLLINVIDKSMESKKEGLMQRLTELLIPYQKHDPISIDPSFALKVRSLREKRIAAHIIQRLRQTMGGDRVTTLPTVDQVIANLSAADISSEDQYGSLEAFEFMQTYYQSAILIFIDNVASLAIEQCLLADLPDIFSFATVNDMDDTTLAEIASESQETRSERERLTNSVATLQKGLRTIEKITPDVRRSQPATKAARTLPSPALENPPVAATVITTGPTVVDVPVVISTPLTRISNSEQSERSRTPSIVDTAAKPQVGTTSFFNFVKPLAPATNLNLFPKPSPVSGTDSGPARFSTPDKPSVFGNPAPITPKTTGLFGNRHSASIGTRLFGSDNSQNIESNPISGSDAGSRLFGSKASSSGGAFGSGLNKTSISSAASPTSTADGGAQSDIFGFSNTTVPSATSPFGSTPNKDSPSAFVTKPFGGSSPGAASKPPSLSLYTGRDSGGRYVLQSLIGTKYPYEHVSFEEIRLLDYASGCRWGYGTS